MLIMWLIDFITQNFVPIMFGTLIFILISGFPVAFGLAATGLIFGVLGMWLDLFPSNLFQILPLRVLGIMQNETLLAIPFFTLMGIILERSGMAEDLLETMGQLFGSFNGGLAISVFLVGALLAASTGITSAVVISMGLISLPVMLRYGYSRSLTSGVITASGALVQALPPSLVLIVMADQLGRSVGDMYAAAVIPGLLLLSVYIGLIVLLSIFKPQLVPALPVEARPREITGRSGRRSLLMLILTCGMIGSVSTYAQIDLGADPVSEVSNPSFAYVFVLSLVIASVSALSIATVNRVVGLKLFSELTERFVFAFIPPVILIFLVLGTIFMGIATPTEGGAMGALGALILSAIKKRLSWSVLSQALEHTARLAVFVMFILIGSTVFSFTFSAADGNLWVESLFNNIPGGELGFILVVCLLVFILGMFLDFFEIAFIVIPLLVPVATSLGIDLIWFGIVVALVLQTSFLTPPFGFALIYLRSVAPKKDYRDAATGKLIAGVKTEEIWKGSMIFVVLQLVVVGLVIAYPQIALGGIGKATALSEDEVMIQLQGVGAGVSNQTDVDLNSTSTDTSQSDDPMADLLNSL